MSMTMLLHLTPPLLTRGPVFDTAAPAVRPFPAERVEIDFDNVIACYYNSRVKQRDPRLGVERPGNPDEALAPLLKALLSLRTPQELRSFLEDLCTPAELEAIADRWRVVPLLLKETPYREIHEQTAVSVTTIGRIARALSFGAGGYRIAAERVLPPSKRARASR